MADVTAAEMIAQSPSMAKETILKLQRHNRRLAQRVREVEAENAQLKEQIHAHEEAIHILHQHKSDLIAEIAELTVRIQNREHDVPDCDFCGLGLSCACCDDGECYRCIRCDPSQWVKHQDE